jgi:hypothetical protein
LDGIAFVEDLDPGAVESVVVLLGEEEEVVADFELPDDEPDGNEAEEDEGVDVEAELTEEENVFAAALISDVNVIPTGPSIPLPFGSSAAS